MRDGEQGSILVETLAALLILAVMAGLWFQTIGGVAQRERAAAERQSAMLVAASALATVGVLEAVSPGTRTGSSNGYAWAIDIERAGTGNLARVTVTVRDAHGGTLAALKTLRPLA